MNIEEMTRLSATIGSDAVKTIIDEYDIQEFLLEGEAQFMFGSTRDFGQASFILFDDRSGIHSAFMSFARRVSYLTSYIHPEQVITAPSSLLSEATKIDASVFDAIRSTGSKDIERAILSLVQTHGGPVAIREDILRLPDAFRAARDEWFATFGITERAHDTKDGMLYVLQNVAP